MTRPYKAIDKYTKKWVFGDKVTLYWPEKYINIAQEGDSQNWAHTIFIEVIPETVCQFTGARDSNNIDAYHGDLVLDGDDKEGCILWCKESLGFFVEEKDGSLNPLYDYYPFQITGSMHDNPETVKG